MKIVSLTTSRVELLELLPLLRELYLHGSCELLCLVTTGEEANLKANPATHRCLREYTDRPLAEDRPLGGAALLETARRALLEERPAVVLWPSRSKLAASLGETLGRLGALQYSPSGAPPDEDVARLRSLRPPRVAGVAPTPAERYLEPHWEGLKGVLEGPCLVQTTPELFALAQARLPHLELHPEPRHSHYPQALSLLSLTFSEEPRENLSSLSRRAAQVFSLEPVNTPLENGRRTFRYGLYDNEFGVVPAEVDLRCVLGEEHRTTVWDARTGRAGDGLLPHPDGKCPAFFTTWPRSRAEWTSRYTLPRGESLKIVFADSGNIAASAIYHSEAVNRFTDSEAWALTTRAHPFVGPRRSTERIFFTEGRPDPDPRLLTVLREADCIVFFEDDDEHSPNWSFPIHRFTEGAAKLHLYIGYRVHPRTPNLVRPGRTILTPLPHLLKMYPGSHFYAGFPPPLEETVPPSPPLSARDGICRFLHTPSLPHWTSSRYIYHKDTESYLKAARTLKGKYGDRVEFHQVAGWSQAQVLKARLECDVTFNQLRGFHGLSGDEAMMIGRPCVQAFDQLNINRHLEYWGLEVDFPWISSHRERLVETFEELLLRPEKRAEIGAASRAFMRKYFSAEKGILPLLYHCYRAARGGN